MIERTRRLRCPYCHDTLAWQGSVCPDCTTHYHFTCASELKHCALLGCGGRLPRLSSQPRPGKGHRRDALAARLLCVGVSLAALAAALVLPSLVEARKLGDSAARIGDLSTIGVSCSNSISHKRGECEHPDPDWEATLDYGTLAELTGGGELGAESQGWIELEAALRASPASRP